MKNSSSDLRTTISAKSLSWKIFSAPIETSLMGSVLTFALAFALGLRVLVSANIIATSTTRKPNATKKPSRFLRVRFGVADPSMFESILVHSLSALLRSLG